MAPGRQDRLRSPKILSGPLRSHLRLGVLPVAIAQFLAAERSLYQSVRSRAELDGPPPERSAQGPGRIIRRRNAARAHRFSAAAKTERAPPRRTDGGCRRGL